MHGTWREHRWQLISALTAIVIAATPVVLVGLHSPARAIEMRFIAWWFCVGVFITALLVTTLPRTDRILIPMLLIQSITGLAANWLIPMAIEGVALTGILLVVAAGGLAALPRRIAIPWVVAQSVGLVGIYLFLWPAVIAVAAGVAYGAMQIVVYSAMAMAGSEREKRITLESTLRELQSTRAMLEETVRSAERSELARDLHDVMGHHLVALGLQLDAASESETPREQLGSARRLVRLLLADVREVVADLRQDGEVDLRQSLQRLATEGPGPRVIVEIDPQTPSMNSGLAQTLLRCAQEGLTNARKHAAATTVRIAIDTHRLTITDNGRGLAAPTGGVGLEGMSERCAATSCTMHVDSQPRNGTTITIEFRKREP